MIQSRWGTYGSGLHLTSCMLQERWFKSKSTRIHYMEGPDSGPPLLLLHGLTQRWQAFLSIIPTLSAYFRVIAPDFRGHGQSGRVADGYRGEQYGADIAELINKQIGGPVLIYGHSLGGMVALWLAAHHPELVRGMVIGDSPLQMDSLRNSAFPQLFSSLQSCIVRRCGLEELMTAVGNIGLDSPALGRVHVKQLPGNDAAFLRSWTKALMDVDPEALAMSTDGRASENWRPAEFLTQVKCPTLLLQGDPGQGSLMSNADVTLALSAVKNAIHVKLDGVGHPLQMHQAAPVLRALLNFFASL